MGSIESFHPPDMSTNNQLTTDETYCHDDHSRAEDAHVCGALGCHASEDRHYRDGNGRERVLCRSCGKDFLEVST